MYNQEELKQYYEKIHDNLEWNFNSLVLGNLTPVERAAAGDVSIRFTLSDSNLGSGPPLNFYSWGNPPAITVPVASVKFFDEICTAYVWLEYNGYSIDTVSDYLGMLKYNTPDEFPHGRYPAPLPTLGIPKDALSNQGVYDDSGKMLKSAIVWILAHELAHILYRHPGNEVGATVSQKNEMEADRFATEIMRRIGVAPVGMAFFFYASTNLINHRGDFSNDTEWEDYLRTKATHPLTADRLKAFAAEMERKKYDFAGGEPNTARAAATIHNAASQIDGLADMISDPDISKVMRARGLATGIDSLKPRPKGSLRPVAQGVKGGNSNMAQVFDGEYSGTYSHYLVDGRIEGLTAVMTLNRTGSRVTGLFNFGMGTGIIEGVVQGETLNYEWQWGEANGKGLFEVKDDGTGLTGTWGYGDKRSGGGLWSVDGSSD